ncbi:phosphopantetheine-binding protein, partial [Acetobacter persici]|uniref:phosphopantetheine-binding protein n=1 Tax=Acetobacter persici TaxID=1076596 RepID=UPI0036DB6BA7
QTEAALLDVFRTVLGRDDIGIHDNFFSAGGDSLSALQIMLRFNNMYPNKISLREIIKRRSVYEILNRDSINRDHIKRIKNSMSNISIFCIHPAFGLCFDYKKIANSIERDCNIIFVESPLFYNEKIKFSSIDEINKYYFDSISEFLTDVNIFISWSLGSKLTDEFHRNFNKTTKYNFHSIRIDPYVGDKYRDVNNKNDNKEEYSERFIEIVEEKSLTHALNHDWLPYFDRMRDFNKIIAKNGTEFPLAVPVHNILSDVGSAGCDKYNNVYINPGSTHESVVKDDRTIRIINTIINAV